MHSPASRSSSVRPHGDRANTALFRWMLLNIYLWRGRRTSRQRTMRERDAPPLNRPSNFSCSQAGLGGWARCGQAPKKVSLYTYKPSEHIKIFIHRDDNHNSFLHWVIHVIKSPGCAQIEGVWERRTRPMTKPMRAWEHGARSSLALFSLREHHKTPSWVRASFPLRKISRTKPLQMMLTWVSLSPNTILKAGKVHGLHYPASETNKKKTQLYSNIWEIANFEQKINNSSSKVSHYVRTDNFCISLKFSNA